MSVIIDIILPVCNEEASLKMLVKRIHISFKKDKSLYRIIAIDDYSSDKSYSILQELSKAYPITLLKKSGKRGKAFSIIQGAKHSTAPFVAMIDADLEYPPEALPLLLEVAKEKGMAVARRISSHQSKFRVFLSKGFQLVFGKLLFGFSCDVQSGLKVFRREVIQSLDVNAVSGWTIDIPLLESARSLNFSIGEVSILFSPRKAGHSKINLFQSITEIGGQAIKYKLSKDVKIVPPKKANSMVGAGIIKRQKNYVTHTTLHPHLSAIHTITSQQQLFILLIAIGIILSFLLAPILALKILIAGLSLIYFLDVVFNLYLVLRSLHAPPEISPSKESIADLKDSDLPIYTIMCPLYKEAHILPHFLEAIDKLSWPKEKLDVLLLLEEDDKETVSVAKALKMPSYVRVLVTPDSHPKTKPKACNYGLNYAKGDYLVIYDAEDIPDPLQLKKAYLGFLQAPPEVKCLQAKLNYHNPYQNLLTRFFTAEYSLWFDVVLPGLQSINTAIPLGGTSNHFKTKDLIALKGWDPFNVTEDCDLGVRLFKKGYKTAIIDSLTLEEANSNWKNWLRQRSRWIKGYMQTYLIHMRNPLQFFRKNGFHALLFQLIVGGKISFMLINPIMWLLTISYFVLYRFIGPTIESFFPSIVFYMAVVSLLFGNFLFMYYYMIGTAKRGHWQLLKWVFLIPFYWLMVSVASLIALYQLIVKPHYWEKTVHGLHLKKQQVEKEIETVSKDTVAAVLSETQQLKKPLPASRAWSFSLRRMIKFLQFKQLMQYRSRWKQILRDIIKGKYKKGTMLVVATMIANVLNMLTNFYMGHALKLHDFAVFNTYLSLLGVITTFSSALSATINQKTASLLGKAGHSSALNFWRYIKNRIVIISTLATLGWIIAIPFLTQFLNFESYVPLILFTPIVLLMGLNSTNQGYLKGSLAFDFAAYVIVSQPLARLLITVIFGESSFEEFAYVSIPGGIIAATIVSSFFARKGKQEVEVSKSSFKLPKTFLLLALISNLSGIAFFTLDNIFVASYLSPEDTGLYGIMGLLGKMIFFTGGLITGFILPITAFQEGKGISSSTLFKKLMLLTAFFSFSAFVVFGLFIPFIAPYFFGYKINAVRHLLPIYSFGILLYTISQGIVQFHLAKKHYIFAIVSFSIALLQILGLTLFHGSLSEVSYVMMGSGFANAFILYLLHHFYPMIRVPLENFKDLSDLFFGKNKFKPATFIPKDSYRILIMNWRDTRHTWAGGAETYIHELSKELIRQGHKVTVFCGSDGHSPRNEVIDNVQIIRRGGFYTVYIWAFLYYVLKLKPHFDIIIDSANGIPFLTPLYAKQPIFLLIHHIHQEVFRTQLRFPLSQIASTIEGKIMPHFYQNNQVITVSDSSKKEIIQLGLGDSESIQVVNPAISNRFIKKVRKTSHPSLVYIGRLKPYKNVDIAIKAFQKVLTTFDSAKFYIAGTGESIKSLKELVKNLNIESSVMFLGHISEEEKTQLFSTSWVAVQPSSIEGWGITVIEANASYTPVVASNVKGLKDSIIDQKTGILVHPRSVDQFAKAISLLFKNEKLRKTMSENAYKWSQEFNWELSCKKFLGVMYSNIQNQYRHHSHFNTSGSSVAETAKVYEKTA